MSATKRLEDANNDLISLLNILISLSIFFVFTLSCPLFTSQHNQTCYFIRNLTTLNKQSKQV